MRAIQILLFLILVILTAKFFPEVFGTLWKSAAFLFIAWITIIIVFWGLVLFAGAIGEVINFATEIIEAVVFIFRSWLALALSPLIKAVAVYRQVRSGKGVGWPELHRDLIAKLAGWLLFVLIPILLLLKYFLVPVMYFKGGTPS